MKPVFKLKQADTFAHPQRKREFNRQLFEVVAPCYDRVTRRLSFNCDRLWKKRLIALLPPLSGPVCVDLACGTGDLSGQLAKLYPEGQVLGLDLTPAMIGQAQARRTPPNVRFRLGDMGKTGVADASVDVVTAGYALRNAGDLPEALGEIARILKPSGVAAILDFSKPASVPIQRMHLALLRIWGGLWGWLMHRDPDVYRYIAESLACYPDRPTLNTLVETAGLETMQTRLFFGGMIEVRLLSKPEGPSQ